MNREDFILFAQHLADQPVNYKYYKATTAIRALKEDSLQFSHPSVFNDPFDVNINLFDFPEEIVSKYFKTLMKKIENTNRYDIPTLHANYKKLENQNLNEVMKNLFKNENADRGITCFSKNNNNLLMWAHYSNTHTGVCLGYDLCELRDFIQEHNPESCLLQANYTDAITPQKDFQNDETIMNWFSTKHVIWNYEEEIRLIARPLSFDENQKKYFNIPKSIIKEVYLGYAISPEDKEKVISLIKNKFNHVRLFQITPDFKTFTLKHISIN